MNKLLGKFKNAIKGVNIVVEVDVCLSDNAVFVKSDFKMNELKMAVEEVGYRIA